VLRAIRAALRPGGRLGFYVIATAEGITDTDRALLARRDGNDHVEAAFPYDRMLSETGFGDVEVTDVTTAFAETLEAWKREWEAEAVSLAAVFGEAEFLRKLENRSLDIEHTRTGLLRRFRVLAVKG